VSSPTVLGIESSCDETAVAVLRDGRVLSNVIATQTIHRKYGGVVPELASRAHHKTITDTVVQALQDAGLGPDEIDVVGVANGPGLMGSLLVGLSFAKGFSLAYGKPLVGVNHLDAHIYANFIEHQERYPAVALIVSGGHTRLVRVDGPFDHTTMGATRDDAAGEAFDKIGKMLGLEYPAGPEIDRLSQGGDPQFAQYPRAMIREGLDFSFSGLKTSVLYDLKDRPPEEVRASLADLCASVSAAIVDVLVEKARRAVGEAGVGTLLLSGGVSANSMLRARMATMAEEEGIEIQVPSMIYCTDNGAMIAKTAEIRYREGLVDDLSLQPYASAAD
jgi:N6-L-threonylcarbamoyladenine synthase